MSGVENINNITAECFNALTQLRELDGPIASPEQIHIRLCGFVESLRERAREQGMSQRDADDMAYAVVALADEIAMAKPEPLGSYWMSQPLQLKYFNENQAGEGFFRKLSELQGDARRFDVLRTFYQCLLFGFQGKYGVRGGDLELMRIIDGLRPEITRHVEAPDMLSPAGDPPDQAMMRRSRRNPFMWVALGVLAVAVAVFIGLRVSLDRRVADLANRVEELSQ
jgi:type VI secretion system protein ImpK